MVTLYNVQPENGTPSPCNLIQTMSESTHGLVLSTNFAIYKFLFVYLFVSNRVKI